MRYQGFATRDYLILENIPINKNSTLLEIGVGLGSIIDKIIGKAIEYCGVDIAYKTIAYLKSAYKQNNSVGFYCLDVCKDTSFLNRGFDIIFSADTLEHISSPQGYFNFIKKHLNPDGVALIVYPNESREKHHGIFWFDKKAELIETIDKAGFKIIALLEVRKSIWHNVVGAVLWELPKSIILGGKRTSQTFDETEAIKIVRSGGVKANVFSFCAEAITRFAALFSLYRYTDIGEDIQNKNLLIRLKHKGQ